MEKMSVYAERIASGEPVFQTERSRAYRSEYLALDGPGRAAHWAAAHKGTLAAAALVAAALCCLLAAPDEAEALPILVPIIAGVLAGAIALDTALPGAVSWISDLLREACNFLFSSAQGFLDVAANGSILGNSFMGMFASGSFGGSEAAGGLAEHLHYIQEAYIIPVAMLIATIVFAIALGSLLSDAGGAEAGIDTWQLCWAFISWAGVSVIIQGSWEMMEVAYNITADLIGRIGGDIHTALNLQVVGDDIVNGGVLLALLLGAILVWAMSIVVALITHASVLVRGFQIYVYTTLAPIALAFLGSRSSRAMATGFIKRWLATLLAGVIMVLLLLCFSELVSGMGMDVGSVAAADGADAVVLWMNNLILSFPLYIAIAFCMVQSGAWAREFVGV